MLKKSDSKNIMFKAGLFIIFTLSLLIFSILWLRFFSLIPDKTIIVKFAEIGPVSTGIPVYYHGVNIGKVSELNFSDDYKYTLVTALIYKKNLNLPKNVYAEIRTTGLTGQLYLEILYPDKPSKQTLKDVDTIEGRLSAIQLAQKDLRYMIKSIATGATDTTKNASEASKKLTRVLTLTEEILNSNRNDIRTFVSEASLSASDFHVASASIKNLSTSPELQQNIKSSASYIPKSSKKLDNITANINKITVDIDKVTGNPKFQEGLIKTISGIGNISESLDKGDLNCLIKKTLEDTDRTINRYDCIGGSFSEMMSERFLLMRLMFGKPGKSFQKCTNLQCIEEENSKLNSCPAYSCPNR